MQDIVIDAPPEARVYVDEFTLGHRYLAGLHSSPVRDLVPDGERRISLLDGREGIQVGRKGHELELDAENVGGLPLRKAVAKAEHSLADEAGRPIFYRPEVLDEAGFSDLVACAVNATLQRTGSSLRLDRDDVLAKPLHGCGFVVEPNDGAVPPDIALMVRSPLFQAEIGKELERFRSSEARAAAFEKMNREIGDEGGDLVYLLKKVVAAKSASGPAREPEVDRAVDIGETVVADRAPQDALRQAARENAEALVKDGATETMNAPAGDKSRSAVREAASAAAVAVGAVKLKPRRKVAAGDLSLSPQMKRLLKEVEARERAVGQMFEGVLDKGLRVVREGKALSGREMALEKGHATAMMIADRLQDIPLAQLDLMYYQTREAANGRLLKGGEPGAAMGLEMLKAEYRRRGTGAVPQPKGFARFKEKFEKILTGRDRRREALEGGVLDEGIGRQRIERGDLSGLRLKGKSEQAVRKVIATWAVGMSDEARGKFATALVGQGVGDKLVKEALSSVPKALANEPSEAELRAAAAAKDRGRGR